MGVVRTGNGWAVKVHLGGGRQRWVGGFKSEQEARTYFETMAPSRTMGAGRGPYWGPVRLGEWFDRLINEGGLCETEVACRRARLRPVMAVVGHLPLDRVTPRALEASLGKVRTDAARARVWGDLRRLFGEAVRRGLVVSNPMDVVPKPKYRPKPLPSWTEEEARRFVEATRSHWAGILFRFALMTGMRQGEILGLEWKHLDLERGVARVEQDLEFRPGGGGWRTGQPKTPRARRSVLLPKPLVEELRTWRVDDKFVFGPKFRPSTISEWMTKLCKEAGVTRVRFHDLRHAHITLLLSRGAPPLLVADRVGHARASFTLERYAWRGLPTGQEALANISLP